MATYLQTVPVITFKLFFFYNKKTPCGCKDTISFLYSVQTSQLFWRWTLIGRKTSLFDFFFFIQVFTHRNLNMTEGCVCVCVSERVWERESVLLWMGIDRTACVPSGTNPVLQVTTAASHSFMSHRLLSWWLLLLLWLSWCVWLMLFYSDLMLSFFFLLLYRITDLFYMKYFPIYPP